ncbi:MAG TPA: glycosyl transferase, partial [Flavobacteriales bacterium]|nr:glycosyl transferase [Flavobacteriales bacterium]
QTYDNWELIVVDGESRDLTVEIVRNFSQEDDRIRLINNPNDDGPAQARSLGLTHAKGSFIAFIDSDDLWLPTKLDDQVTFMIEHDHYFTFTSYKKMFTNQSVSKAVISGHNSNTFKQYLRRRGISNSTVMLRKECISAEVLLTVGKSHGEDTLWWLLIMRQGFDAIALQKPLTIYRMVDNSLSTKVMNNQRTVWHSYRNELNLSIAVAAYNYALYLVDVALRRAKFLIKNSL